MYFVAVDLIDRIIPHIPIQVHPAPVPYRVTRHKLAELRVVELVLQQVDEAVFSSR